MKMRPAAERALMFMGPRGLNIKEMSVMLNIRPIVASNLLRHLERHGAARRCQTERGSVWKHVNCLDMSG